MISRLIITFKTFKYNKKNPNKFYNKLIVYYIIYMQSLLLVLCKLICLSKIYLMFQKKKFKNLDKKAYNNIFLAFSYYFIKFKNY